MNYLHPSHRIKGIYQSPVPTKVSPPGALPKILYKALTTHSERVPGKQMGPFRTETAIYRQPAASGLRVTWLGHSTLLLEVDGTTILTDPVWGARTSPVSWLGPKRFYPPPLALADLPPVDLVLLSHDHYDHLDAGTIRTLAARVPVFVCSQGVGAYLRRWGVPSAKIDELDWGQSYSTASGREAEQTPLTITALPARHFSGRFSRRNRTLWSSFVIKTARRSIYFGADSGYYPGFAELGAAYGPFDLTMLEIGAFDSLWPDIHLGPDGAMRAHLDLGGGPLLPIHWGLFNLAFHAWYEPVERLVDLARLTQVPLLLPSPGMPVELASASLEPTPWWLPYKS
jgi:L-ascorbate metabolism protein UlaG (beta-lactamase superfamily)